MTAPPLDQSGGWGGRAGVAGNDEIPQQGHENREWSNKKGAAAAAPEPT